MGVRGRLARGRGRFARAICLAGIVSVAGCDLAPAYRPVRMVLPDRWDGYGIWRRADPADHVARGPWWRQYGNPTLDALEERLPDNPDLQAEAERFRQSRDIASEAESQLYPQLAAGYAMSENRQSIHRLFRSPASRAPLEESNVAANLLASWEIDVWERIANATRSARRRAQAEDAALASLRLSLQAELAQDYIALRGLDGEAGIYRESIAYYAKGLRITELRLSDQIGSGLDVGRARTQVASAQAGLLDVTAARALALHAIAALIGVPAGALSIPPQQAVPMTLPSIPVSVPSALLQRRPDIAEAERLMAAQNAEIGVARAAFFPNVTLGAAAGLVDSGFNLVDLPNSMWTVGSTILLPLFEGGLRRAVLDQAGSAYRQTRDTYRAVVLAAMQQTEDAMAEVALLSEENERDREAVQAAARVQALALQLYTAGADSYLNVVVAQVADLTSGVSQVQTATRAMQASVALIRALGGGWDASEVIPAARVPRFDPLVP